MCEPRILLAPGDLEEVFLTQAQENTSRGIETCGLLCGKVDVREIAITHLLIPPQRGTHNTVEMLDDEAVATHLIDNQLQVIGWIHTHPTQTAFLSSIDTHTQYSYQALLEEAVAVVCAPTYGTNKWFRLTESGMRIVGGCTLDGFHDHASNSRLFHSALKIAFCNRRVVLVKLNEEEQCTYRYRAAEPVERDTQSRQGKQTSVSQAPDIPIQHAQTAAQPPRRTPQPREPPGGLQFGRPQHGRLPE